MKNILTRIVPLVIALLTLALPYSASADSKELLSMLPYHFIRLAPDGVNVATYVDAGSDNRRVFIIDTQNNTTSRTTVSDGKNGQGVVNDLRWVGSNHLMVMSNGDDGDTWLHTYKLGDKFPERLTKEGKNTFLKSIAGTTKFLVTKQVKEGDSQMCQLLEYDVTKSGEPKEIYSCVSNTFECVTDAQGRLRMVKRDEGTGANTAWYAINRESGEETKLNNLQQWNKVHGMVEDTANAIISGQLTTALPSVYSFNIEKDKVGQVLADNPTYSIDTYGKAVFEPSDGKVVGLHLDAAERRSFWTDKELAGLQSKVDAKLLGTTNRLISWSADRKHLLVERFIATLPTQYLHYDIAHDKITAVAVNGPNVTPDEVGSTKLVEIPNRDGTIMTAVLTAPIEKTGGKLPLLIWLRNGLWQGLDRPEWHPEANYFAAEGFVVLRINYSGSEGLLGDLAVDTNSKAGINKTFADIEDSVKALINAGLVDPDKVCIGGEGVAAWAAAYAPIANPDTYQSVLCFNGVYDLVEYRQASKGNNEMSGGSFLNFANAGSPLSDTELLSLSIPQNLSDYPKTVFVTLGKWSPQPYKNHVQDFVKSLKKARVTAKLENDDWWGAQLYGYPRVQAFMRAANVAKSAVK